MARKTDSVWTMLLWKEWRQQRLVALLVAGVCLGAYLAYCRTGHWEGDGTVLLVLAAVAGLCLGANAFTAEAEDRTEGFLARLPTPVWQLLAIRYLFALVLTLLCLVVPVCVLPPVGAEWLAPFLRFPQTPQNWALLAVAAASGGIALAAIVARTGLGSMGTWLAAGLLGAAIVGFMFATELNGRLVSPYFVLSSWGLIQLCLLQAWRRQRTIWRAAGWIALWIVLALLAPLLPGTTRVLWRHASWGLPDYLAGVGQEGCYVDVVPSPDGRSLAVNAQSSWDNDLYSAGTWLLDVDTGQAQRIGPWWRNCHAILWDAPTCWSPDSKQVRMYTVPALHWTEKSATQWRRETDERIYDVQGDAPHIVDRQSTIWDRWSCWLKDETVVKWTPAAWEFTNPATGEVRRCLHTPGEDHDPYNTHGRRAWLDTAIVTVAIDRDADGKGWLHAWRSAPELAEAQRGDFPVDWMGAEQVVGAWLFSNDGRWLVLFLWRAGQPVVIGPLSLVDGTGDVLKPPDGCDVRGLRFTPDSRLLIVPSSKSLQVWNVATRQWEAQIGLPLWRTRSVRICSAVSPTPPWRVALGVDVENSVYLADLAQGTVAKVFSTPFGSDKYTWRCSVQWLGNDRLLVQQRSSPYRLWVVDADGSNQRQVLP